MSNICYSPEEFGLKVVANASREDLSYEFDDFIVWQHVDTGRYYWASDAGCSCPSPFEDYRNLDDLTSGTVLDALNDLSVWIAVYDEYYGETSNPRRRGAASALATLEALV